MIFEIILYPTNAVLKVLVTTHEKAIDYFKGKDDNLPWCNGYSYSKFGEYIIYLNSDLYSQGTIAHEAVHISWMLNDKVNLLENGFDYSSQELQAYMVSYMVNEINNNLNKQL